MYHCNLQPLSCLYFYIHLYPLMNIDTAMHVCVCACVCVCLSFTQLLEFVWPLQERSQDWEGLCYGHRLVTLNPEP